MIRVALLFLISPIDGLASTDGLSNSVLKRTNALIRRHEAAGEDDMLSLEIGQRGQAIKTPAAPPSQRHLQTQPPPTPSAPTEAPTDAPTEAPTDAPTEAPTDAPTEQPEAKTDDISGAPAPTPAPPTEDEGKKDDDDDADGPAPTPAPEADDEDVEGEDGEQSMNNTMNETNKTMDFEEKAPVPAPAKPEVVTNSSDFIPPAPSPWFPAPSPPPAPMSLEDFLGPTAWSPSPVPPSPEDSSLCKAVDGVKVKDTRDVHTTFASVSVKRHGEKKNCGNGTLVLGTFPNGRLTSCAWAVASNQSCGNDFQLHKDTYECACVAAWSMCESQDEESTCLYELNPGEERGGNGNRRRRRKTTTVGHGDMF